MIIMTLQGDVTELLDRVTRIESRLVQLMNFLGADIHKRYEVPTDNYYDETKGETK